MKRRRRKLKAEMRRKHKAPESELRFMDSDGSHEDAGRFEKQGKLGEV